MNLREGCNKILKVDCVQLQEKIYKKMKRGFCVPNTSKCASCNMSIIHNDRESDSVVVFYCNHTYHARCLKNKSQQKDEQQKNPKLNSRLVCEICYNVQHKNINMK